MYASTFSKAQNNTFGHERSKSAFSQKRGKFLAYKLRILKEKRVFLGLNVRGKNADMFSFIVLSEGAGADCSHTYNGMAGSKCVGEEKIREIKDHKSMGHKRIQDFDN